jgi:hypothetical protein
MESEDTHLQTAQPELTMATSEEAVVLHVQGFAVLVATYEAEGYYDEEADGDPEEQDLYRIEVLDAREAVRASEAVDGEPVWPLVDMGLMEPTVRQLFPAARWTPDGDELAVVKRYLLVLAHELWQEEHPLARQRLLEASASWSPVLVEDGYRSLPSEWRQARGR